MEGALQPITGYTAFVMRPDPLFPYEVLLFMLFGGLFLVASFFEFRNSLKLTGRNQIQV
jgi:hypothetical protein